MVVPWSTHFGFFQPPALDMSLNKVEEVLSHQDLAVVFHPDLYDVIDVGRREVQCPRGNACVDSGFRGAKVSQRTL